MLLWLSNLITKLSCSIVDISFIFARDLTTYITVATTYYNIEIQELHNNAGIFTWSNLFYVKRIWHSLFGG